MKKKLSALFLASVLLVSLLIGETQKNQSILVQKLNNFRYSFYKVLHSLYNTTIDEEYSNLLDISFDENEELVLGYKKVKELVKEHTLTSEQQTYKCEKEKSEIIKSYKEALSNSPKINMDKRKKFIVLKLLNNEKGFVIENERDKAVMHNKSSTRKYVSIPRWAFLHTTIENLSQKDKRDYIDDTQLERFTRFENADNPLFLITELKKEEIEDALSSFPPYLFTLGKAYQDVGMSYDAKECYKKCENLNHLMTPSLITKLNKNMVLLLLNEDPIANKEEIIKRLSIMSLNSKDKSLIDNYRSKVYYILGEEEKALEIAKDVINRERKNSSSYLDAKCFIDLIGKSFSQKLFEKLNVQTDERVYLFNPFDIDVKDQASYIKERVHFVLPFDIIKGNTIKVLLNDKPFDIKVKLPIDHYKTLYVIDYKASKIKEDTNLTITLIDKVYSTEKKVIYIIKPIDKKIMIEGEKALNLIGGNINYINPFVPYNLGEKIVKENYKYESDNKEKKCRIIAKEMDKENKKNNINEPTYVFSYRVEEKFQDLIFSDIKNISKMYEEICREKKYLQIKNPILKYFEDYAFIVRLKQISEKL